MHAFACRNSVRLMRRRRLLLAVTAFAFLCLPAVAPAWAVPPANDARDNAAVIGALPFSGTVDTTEATIGPEDDAAAATCGLVTPYPKSVWYRYTAASDHDVVIDTAGSNYSVGVGVGSGGSCVATFAGAGGFSAQAGQTYFIGVVDIGAGAGGSLELSVELTTRRCATTSRSAFRRTRRRRCRSRTVRTPMTISYMCSSRTSRRTASSTTSPGSTRRRPAFRARTP